MVIFTVFIAVGWARIMTAKRFIMDGVFTPIMVIAFPGAETCFMHRVKRQPHMVGSEIEIGSADHSYVFISIPDIRIWNRLNHDCRRRRRGRGNHHYGRRRCRNSYLNTH
jgi:hypothetical protein